MKPDDTTRRVEPAEDRDENIHVEHEVENKVPEALEPQPTGWAAQLRQIMQRSTQGEAKTNVKRQQLKEDRTKSFLLLAGLTVVLSLAFFAMFSTPNAIRQRLLWGVEPKRVFLVSPNPLSWALNAVKGPRKSSSLFAGALDCYRGYRTRDRSRRKASGSFPACGAQQGMLNCTHLYLRNSRTYNTTHSASLGHRTPNTKEHP
jgi:hypothetical protein